MINLDEEIKELLSDLDINKILVAERNPDSLAAAEKYFTTLHKEGILVRFSMTEADAKEKIRESFHEDKRYNMVMSDYRLDGAQNGLGVMREAMRCGMFGTLNLYEKTDDPKEPHNTHLMAPCSSKETLTLPKDDPACWDLMTFMSLLYLNRDDYMESLQKVGRLGKEPLFGEGVSKNFYKYVMKTYDMPLEENAPILQFIECRYKLAFGPDYGTSVDKPEAAKRSDRIISPREMRRDKAH